MDAPKNIQNLKDLLQHRIAGHAGAEEERRLSKQAAEDPFLQEALEGLDAFPEGDHAARLARLQDRLERRTRRRMVPIFVQRAAAAVLVLGLFGLGWWLLFDGKGELPGSDAPQVMVTPPVAPVPAPLADDTQPKTSKEIPQPTPPRSRPEASPQTSELSVSPQPGELASSEKPAAVIPSETSGTAAAAELADVAPEAEQKKESAAAHKMQPDAAKPQPSRTATTAPAPPAASPAPAGFRVISGKILDGDTSDPLIGATVLLEGTQQGTVTDIDGSYRLQIPAKDTDARLIVAYTGYENKVVSVGERDKLNVNLDGSSAALSEVVVVGLGKKRKAGRSPAIRSTSANVQPRNGWDALEQHIAVNRRMPVQAVANGISGQVVVEFSVTTKGKLRGFKVLESLGFGCDEEAVRLLQTGPVWENATGKEQKASYSVQF